MLNELFSLNEETIERILEKYFVNIILICQIYQGAFGSTNDNVFQQKQPD